jgi:hypothetical protein
MAYAPKITETHFSPEGTWPAAGHFVRALCIGAQIKWNGLAALLKTLLKA